MSRDVQVRVVFCDWLAWLLRMKRGGHDVSLTSLLDSDETRHRNNVEDLSHVFDRHLPSMINDKVYQQILYRNY